MVGSFARLVESNSSCRTATELKLTETLLEFMRRVRLLYLEVRTRSATRARFAKRFVFLESSGQ
eukprot:1264143-Pyramimonas_sp.AAC.1